MIEGSCNCGAIEFSVTPNADVSACHCGQCRKQSGHHWASGSAEVSDFEIKGDVSWYAASDSAKRGFCGTCGCFLFWKHNDETSMSFSLGVIDGPTGLTITRHIFTADKGDYYDIADGVPQREH